MTKKRKLLRSQTDARIRRTSWLLRILILLLSAQVAYDALVYKTPLYYLVFVLAGAFVGRSFMFAYKVDRDRESGKFTLTKNISGIVFSVLLILFRYLYAEEMLESMQVRWVNDGIYLFFIGLNWSKLQVIYRQVENRAIELFTRGTGDSKGPPPGVS